jgi:hypothetical protein
VRSSTALTANGVTPVASRIDVSGKVATLTLNFTTAGAVTGTVYTIDDFNLNPSAVIYATGGSANGISQVSLLVTVTPSAGPPAPALIDINALSPTLAGSINFIQVTYMLA